VKIAVAMINAEASTLKAASHISLVYSWDWFVEQVAVVDLLKAAVGDRPPHTLPSRHRHIKRLCQFSVEKVKVRFDSLTLCAL